MAIPRSAPWLVSGAAICGVAYGDQIVCMSNGAGRDSCDITLPNVLADSTTYPAVTFQPGDTVVISASGCVQTGGQGKTWKDYVNPRGPNSDHLYHGLISIPGVTSGPVRLSTVVGNTALPPSTGGPLVLGYEDDDFSDNGYWSHDDGTDDQCKDQSGPNRGRAAVHLDIHRAATPPSPVGTVFGQCSKTDATHETCHIDRPDVTQATEAFSSVRFCPGDAVVIRAQGCVQTGGHGDTWKSYVNPSGDNADHLYHGQIYIPGVTQNLVRLNTVVGNNALPPATGGTLTLGYEDDDLSDNGYWSHDDGTENQCRGIGPASLDISITHKRAALSGCGNIIPVTGITPDTEAATQSETAATVVSTPGGRRVVVTFNDQTQSPTSPTITFTPSTRSVQRGASLMGWAYSDDDGHSWTYAGRVAPPVGWPVLWGDPAITSVPDPSASIVFMSNLAVPPGIFAPGANVTAVGGACIAKSTDGGTSFAPPKCISNMDPPFPAGHFYDGEALAATPSGAIYAAYEDTSTARVDVWQAANPNADFVRIAEPFPNMMAFTHARLRAAADDSLYAASVFPATLPNGTTGLFVFINRFANGAWGTPQRASEAMVSGGVPVIDLNSHVLGSELTIRMGPQYAFDVGSASVGGQDAVRILVTRRDAATGRFYIQGSACAADLSACHPVPEWQVGPTATDGSPLQAFQPVVVAAPTRVFGRPPSGRVVIGPWLGAYYVVKGTQTTTVQTAHMYLNYLNGTAVGTSVELPDPLTVCSDTRGYWGDYNGMVSLPSLSDTTTAFVSFVSEDLQLGCVTRDMFRGIHQHVSAVRWDP